MEYQNRQFMIFNISDIYAIDFSEVLETSMDTVRKSLDGTKTFVKWDSEQIPTSVESLSIKWGPYTYSEMLEILAGIEWTAPKEMI